MPKQSKIDQDPEKFKEEVRKAKGYADLIRAFGYKESGGIYVHLKSKIEKYKLDTSHFLGAGWAKGKTRDTSEGVENFASKIEKPWNEVFTKVQTKVHGKSLLKRLIRAGKREWKCEECGGKEWMGKPIPLNIHHKNEDNRDNHEENLLVLCLNCHGLKHPYKVFAQMVKLADTQDRGSCAERRVGSTPTLSTSSKREK